MTNAILLISCPDRKGITAAITQFIAQNNGNIVHADQHLDDQSNTFFIRIEWAMEGFTLPRERIREEFSPIAHNFQMDWQLHFSDQLPRLALFCGKQLHCLLDILWRYKAGQLPCVIPLIVSNHPQAREVADQFKIPFYEFCILPDSKREQEWAQIKLLEQKHIDSIVLARYQQILTPQFIGRYRNRIINIHHSFLPAFVGANPYAQAYERGVKIIGATSHYVTEELDQGPIIEQDVVRISHRHRVGELRQMGEDLEKVVLSRAVRWDVEHKILCYGNKTVIFD